MILKKNNHEIQNISLLSLAEKYGTPLYVYEYKKHILH